MTLGQLTRRQQAVFDYIRKCIQSRGYGPTVREIGKQFQIDSPNGVVGHLVALERKGLIVRRPNKSRAIELTPEYLQQTRGLPLVGAVSAGSMLEAVEQDERVDFEGLFEKRGTYALQVRGDSMIEAQIADGDYVIVQPRREAQRGDIVVARTEEGEATVKYYFPERGRVRLQPANSRLKPTYVRNAKIIGVVVGVVRRLK